MCLWCESAKFVDQGSHPAPLHGFLHHQDQPVAVMKSRPGNGIVIHVFLPCFSAHVEIIHLQSKHWVLVSFFRHCWPAPQKPALPLYLVSLLAPTGTLELLSLWCHMISRDVFLYFFSISPCHRATIVTITWLFHLRETQGFYPFLALLENAPPLLITLCVLRKLV